MEITRKNTPNYEKKKKKLIENFSIKLIIFSFFLFVIIFSFLVYKITIDYFPSGIRPWLINEAKEFGFRQLNHKTRFFDALSHAPKYFFEHTDIPEIFIDIKFKHLEKLRSKREKALQVGILEKSGDDFVPAEIRIENRTIKTKLRLKGDWTDHLEGKKWSFRIHVKGKDHLFGLRRFSIQHPKTRGFQSEILFLETLRKYGILSLRYMFVNVTVNGDDIGVMALEEHFAKELLEYNGRKEGVIIRYDELFVWKATDGANRGFGGAFDNYLNAKIDAFCSSKIRKSMRLSHENATAVGLLRSFASGDLDASDVFDAKQLAGFLAVSEFFRSSHAVRWHNLRFYLNPISMKLEPIGFDGDINHPSLYPMPLSAKEPILRKMFDDPIILKSYHVILKNIIDDFKSGELVSFLKEKEKIPLSQLRREFYFLDCFNYDQLNHYEKMITTDYRYNKIKAEKYPAFIHAFLINENDSRYVEIFNALPFPVEISSIKWREKSGNHLEFKSKDTFSLPLVLKPNVLSQYARPLRLNFHAAPKIDKITLEIVSNIQDSDVTKQTIASKYYPTVNTSPLPTIDISNLLEIHPYLSIPEKNIISVKKGEWIVDKHIIIPSEYTFFIPEGVVLRFNSKAGLISYGAVDFNGTKNNPITLTGKLINGSSKEGTWQGIAVLHSKKRSSLTHTSISNTTGINQNRWSLTAGTTFYMSDVTINNCTFVNNKCEDTLNIIHSDFSFNKIVMKNCSSDAFDSDFSTGEILQGYFQDIGYAGGGDAVDTSGSTVSLKDSHFIRVDDKAISIGERSTFNGERITIEDSGVAVVSKDGSVVNIKDVVIKNCKTASLMAYVKKPEYGPSKLIGSNISIAGNAKEAVAQDKSKIVLNGKTIETETLNVNNLYNTVMKPGLKK